MLVRDNPLTNVFRWAEGNAENFTTDAFATVLRHLADRHPRAAGLLVRQLCGVDLPPPEAVAWDIRTQESLEHEPGTFDLRVRAGFADIIVESELGGEVDRERLARARRALDPDGPNHRLVSLTGRLAGPVPEGIEVRLWYQVAGWLQGLEETGALDEVGQLVVRQFLELLYHQGLAAPRARSELSRGLSAHREKLGADLESPLFGRSVRSLAPLDEHPELHPIRDLLGAVRRVLAELPGSESASIVAAAGQWVGVSLNRLEFVVSVELHEPDRLVVERWKHAVDPSAFDGREGEIFKGGGAWRWRTSLDLADPDGAFFDRDAGARRQRLHDFLAPAVAYGRALSAAAPTRPAPRV